MTERYIAFDLEMPGQHEPRISAIGITVVENRKITDRIFYLVNPETEFDPYVVKLIGITPEMVENEPTFPEIWEKIRDIMSSGLLVAHGASGDISTLCGCLKHYGIEWQDRVKYLCTCNMGLVCYPELEGHSLDVMCEHIGFELNHHHALSDSEGCARLLLDYLEKGMNIDEYVAVYDVSKCCIVKARKKKKRKTFEQKVRGRLFRLKSEELRIDTLANHPEIPEESVIGVSMQSQKAMADEIFSENKSADYTKCLPHGFHEENNIHAMLLSQRKKFSALVEQLERFLPYVNNKQTCGLLDPKLFKKCQPELVDRLCRWLKDENPYTRLFALNMVDKYFMKNEFIDTWKECVSAMPDDAVTDAKREKLLTALKFADMQTA